MAKTQQPKFKKFRCPPLSSSRKEQIQIEANNACDDLIKFSASDLLNASGECTGNGAGDGLEWEYEEQLNSVRIEKVKVKADNKKSIHYFRGITQVEATIDEVLELYKVDIEHPNSQLESKLSPDLMHSVILYEIKPYSLADNTIFMGIRWSAMRSPYMLVRNRDYCYLECQRQFTLADGRRGFARCSHSVKIKSCPDMEESHNFVRASMYRSGYVFVESRRDRRVLEVVQAVYTDLKGSVPQWVAAVAIRSRMMNLEHLKKYLSMKRLANQTFARRSELMVRGNVKTCFVCVDDIGTFKRKYNCHKCGEVICGKCKLNMSADIPVVGKMKLTICSLCSLAMNRNLMPDAGGGSGSLGSSQNNSNRGQGHRPFSITTPQSDGGNGFNHLRGHGRRRANSLHSFHTANFDQTTIYNSMLSAEV